MTEAKSPREIAESIAHRDLYTEELADQIEQALIAYAAEPERLLSEADASLWDAELSAEDWKRFRAEARARFMGRRCP